MTVVRRSVREGLVGLLLLVGVVVGVGLLLWINNFRAGNDIYKFSVVFTDANGMSAGVPVRLRGVDIGQVTRVTPSIEKVIVEAVVDQPDVILPRQARYVVGQRGLIGETFLEILPEPGVKSLPVSVQEFKKECREQQSISTQVVCPGVQLEGETPARVLDLVRSLNTLANRINSGFLDELQQTVHEIGTDARKFGDVADDVKGATREFSQTAREIGSTSREISQTARAFTKVASTADLTVADVGKASTNVSKAANELSGVVSENRLRLAATLENLGQISHDLSLITPSLANPDFSKSLVSLAQNAAESAANIRRLSAGLSDPATIDALRETLDSARSTFKNAEKISTDLDQLTGDPQFRANLRRLVEGLGKLVSTAEAQAPTIQQVTRHQ